MDDQYLTPEERRAKAQSELAARIAARVLTPPVRQAIERTMRDAARTVGPVLGYLNEHVQRLREQVLRPEVIEGIRRLALSLRDSLPPNWRDHDIDFARAIDCAVDDGIPVVWVPPGHIVASLSDARHWDARCRILERFRYEILSACTACLEDISGPPDVQILVPAAHEAVQALGNDLPMPAQALAAAVVDGAVKILDRNWLRKTAFHENTPLSEVRTALVAAAAVAAIATHHGGPPPRGFNRHRTAHGFDPTQRSVPHATIAVMLAVSLLREASERDTEKDS